MTAFQPLFKSASRPDRLPPGGHTGLWYDKYCNLWQKEGDPHAPTLELGTNKAAWIKATLERYKVPQEALDEAIVRMIDLTQAKGGRLLAATATGPFVTGLGRAHPVENGFTWHPTLGVPYLPGSSIKGLLRAWLEQNPELADMADWLGKGGDHGHAGRVQILDALPTGAPALQQDVITPHHTEYLQGHAWPADWQSPNPIPFLTMKPGATFLFALLPGRGADDAMLEKLVNTLADALAIFGAGAKTAVGYGRFREDAAHLRRLEAQAEARRTCRQRAREEAEMHTYSPERQEQIRVGRCTEQELLNRINADLLKGGLTDEQQKLNFIRAVRSTAYYRKWDETGEADPRSGLGRSRLREYLRALALPGETAPGADSIAGHDLPEQITRQIEEIGDDKNRLHQVAEALLGDETTPRAALEQLQKLAKQRFFKKVRRLKPRDSALMTRLAEALRTRE
ncbi:MAG: type III-B CRISPR module RAMP protein Cmr6 [Planctomycetota bacterium]